MSFFDWLRNTQERYATEGLWGATQESIFELYKGGLRRMSWTLNPGTSVYEKEWDVLVVLDACRLDLFQEIYTGPREVKSFTSVGSMSADWMENTFLDEPETSNTAYVTANIFSRHILDESSFLVLDEVWDYRWNDEYNTILPEDVTERAIHNYREHDPDRLIVHYMQPHFPFLEHTFSDGLGQSGPWDMLSEKKLTKEEIWKAYRRNLEIAIEEVTENLQRNVDGKMVLTADHGNSFGEYGIYGHPRDMPLGVLRTVPWCVLEATDEGTIQTDTEDKQNETEVDIENRLENLGYK